MCSTEAPFVLNGLIVMDATYRCATTPHPYLVLNWLIISPSFVLGANTPSRSLRQVLVLKDWICNNALECSLLPSSEILYEVAAKEIEIETSAIQAIQNHPGAAYVASISETVRKTQ